MQAIGREKKNRFLLRNGTGIGGMYIYHIINMIDCMKIVYVIFFKLFFKQVEAEPEILVDGSSVKELDRIIFFIFVGNVFSNIF